MRSGKEARPVETPAVVWAGDEPVGQLESDPWVRTLRDAFLALAAATNTVDFTDGALSATWREDIVQRAATLARSQLDTDNAYVVLGPRPFTPVEVNVEAGEVSGITRIGPPRSPYLLPDGTEVTSEYCDGLTIPRAVFRPEPDLQALSKKGRDDVVLPTPSSSQQP